MISHLSFARFDATSPTPEAVRAMTYAQLSDVHSIGGWSPEAIEALGTNIRYVRPRAFTLIRDDQLSRLSNQGWQVLSPEQVSALTGGQRDNRFSEAQLRRMSQEARAVAGRPHPTYLPDPDFTSSVVTPVLPDAPLPTGGAPLIVADSPAIAPLRVEAVVPPVPSPNRTNDLSIEQRNEILAASHEDQILITANKCIWSKDLPRRIGRGPNNCSERAGRRSIGVCYGYVECHTGTVDAPGIKFLRLATCSPDSCRNEDADNCVADQSFTSISLTEEDDASQVSDDLRTIITTPESN